MMTKEFLKKEIAYSEKYKARMNKYVDYYRAHGKLSLGAIKNGWSKIEAIYGELTYLNEKIERLNFKLKLQGE